MCIYSFVYMYIMATHSSILAWEIPWMEKPGRLWSMGSQRVRHDWTTSLHFIYSDCFLMQVITRYWVFFPVLYNRTLLFSTLYIIACICYSHIPNLFRPFLFPLISKFAFYVWVCFCFINKFIWIICSFIKFQVSQYESYFLNSFTLLSLMTSSLQGWNGEDSVTIPVNLSQTSRHPSCLANQGPLRGNPA